MITLKNITLRRSAKLLLENASVNLNPGEKVGLVGRNGAGKSSLFALLNGGLHEDVGEFYIPPHWRMGQVAQDMPETEQSATEFVVDGDTQLLSAQQEVTAAEATDDYDRMAHAYMALQDAGAHDAPARAQALILGLGFKNIKYPDYLSALMERVGISYGVACGLALKSFTKNNESKQP